MVSTTALRRTGPSRTPRPSPYPLLERHVRVYRRAPVAFASGFLEPLFYLLSIGVGIAALVGEVTLDDGRTIGYTAFLAPAMLATQAMNGAIFDATFGFFFRLKYEKLYDAVLATPLRPVDAAVGEVLWATTRGSAYAAVFVVIMVALDLTSSWWTVLALPAALLVAFGFASAGLALTTWMRSWQDFEFIQVAIMPMFFLSATFYPLSAYPEGMQLLVQVTPLYQAVDLIRSLTTGDVGPGLLLPVAYFVVMGVLGLRVAGRRVGLLILR